MAANRTQLTVEILTDATKAAQGLNETAGRFESMGKKAAAALAGAFAVDKLLDFGRAAITAASNLEQAVGGVNLIFGDSAKVITDWAQDTEDNFRVPAEAAMKFATTMGNALMQSGRSASQAADDTKKLAQVGADLASAYGGDVVGALDAVNAAISKGEWERLESFGVTVKASDVSAEMNRIADSMGGLTAESEGAIRTQASINLLMKEAAPAMGAAASEAETYAAKQDKMREKMAALLAAVGGPLLDAFGGLMDIFSALAPAISVVLTAIAGLLAAVIQLPAPVIATAVAFAGWMILSSVAGGVSLVTTVMVNLRVALLLTSAAVKTFFASIGPVGWAILAVGAIATVITTLMDFSSEAENAQASWEKLAEATKAGGAEGFKSELFDAGKLGGFNDALTNAGVSMKTYIDAASGVPGSMAALTSEVEQATAAIFDQGGAFQSIGADAKAAGISQADFLAAVSSGDLSGLTAQMQDYANAQAAASGNTQDATDIMARWGEATSSGKSTADALVNAVQLAGDANKVYADTLGVAAEKAAALGTAEGATTAIILEAEARTKDLADTLKAAKIQAERTAGAGFLAEVKTDADAAARALDIFSAAMDAATRKVELTDNALLAWSETMASASTDIGTYATSVAGGSDALAAWDINTLRSTESGRAAAQTALDSAASYQEVVSAAFSAAAATGDMGKATSDAQAAASNARGEFIGMAEAAGLTTTQAAQLADQLGILDATQIDPKVFEVIAQDAQAQAAVAALIAQGIDPKSFTVTANTDPATGQVTQLLTYTDAAGATVTVDASTNPATGDIGAVEKGNYNATVKTGAETAQAVGQINQAAAGQYKGTISVGANTSEANRAVTDTLGYINRLSGTITVQASDQASNTIRSIASAYYQATIVVKADTSAFMSAFNSLPTTKGVSQASAPLMAGVSTLAGVRGLSAPSPQLVMPAPSGTVINISGAIDPESTARQIRAILRGSDYRSGSISAGVTV